MASKASRRGKSRSNQGNDPFWERKPDKAKELSETRRVAQIAWKRVNPWRIFVVLLLLVGPMLGLAGLVFPAQETPETPVADFAPSGKTQATMYVENWLKDGSPLEEGRILSWDGVTNEKAQTGSGSSKRSVPLVVHSFTLADKAGDVWKATLTVRKSDGSPVSEPMLEKDPTPELKPSETPDWSGTLGLTNIQSTDPAGVVVEKWAQAYMGSSSQQLTVLVADPDGKHAYRAADIGEVQSATVEKAAYLNRGHVNQKESASNWAVARVGIEVLPWNAKKDSQPVQLDYDVLLKDPDSGSARVVAWGAVGTGAELKAYRNAVTGTAADALRNGDRKDGDDTEDTTGEDTTGDGTTGTVGGTDTGATTEGTQEGAQQ